jgi:hypothetical protein
VFGVQKSSSSRGPLCIFEEANLHLVPPQQGPSLQVRADREACAHDTAIISLFTHLFPRSWHSYCCRWYDGAGVPGQSSGPPVQSPWPLSFAISWTPFPGVVCATFKYVYRTKKRSGSMVTEAILEGRAVRFFCLLAQSRSQPRAAAVWNSAGDRTAWIRGPT